MLCVLIGHSHLHEIQTITQLFFPHTRFSFAYEMDALSTQTGVAVLSRLHDQACEGVVYRDGTIIVYHLIPITGDEIKSEGTGSLPDVYGSIPVTPVKRLLALALFRALKEVFDLYAPWGALTGIRPSKLVRQWLAEGADEATVLKTLTKTFHCHENKARLAIETAHAEHIVDERIRMRTGSQPPLGLYISIPYCPSRCSYCSFNTCNKPASEETLTAYIRALIRELTQTAQTTRDINGVFTSVYIGGGTPTVLSEMLLDALLTAVRQTGAFAPDFEYTVEAGRPDSLTPGKLRLLKEYGVTRVAVNPQTLNDDTLRLIGRSHTVADFYRSFDMARMAGFSCINTDIIAGLPGEGSAEMRRTADGLARLKPENITVHTLAVKRASRLNEKRAEQSETGEHADANPTANSAYVIEEMLAIARDICDAAGLRPYYLYRQKHMIGLFENVGYSLPGCECLYNVGMMAETQTILGAGAGAVSKFVNGTRIERTYNVKNPDIYIKRILTNGG